MSCHGSLGPVSAVAPEVTSGLGQKTTLPWCTWCTVLVEVLAVLFTVLEEGVLGAVEPVNIVVLRNITSLRKGNKVLLSLGPTRF